MNKKPRILVLGSSGLVGIPLCKILESEYELTTTYYQNKFLRNDLKLDIQNIRNLESVFAKANPEIVINLSGIYKNLEFCENNKNFVMAVNGESLKTISKISNQYNAYMVSVSSDFVFDGKKGNYSESDETSPISFYGKSRLEGEKNVQNISKKYCLIRTSMIYGKNPVRNTLADLIYSKAIKGETLELINDQFLTPTYLENFCLMMFEIIKKQYEGIINLAGPEKISKYEFGKKLLKLMNISDELLLPVSKDHFKFGKEFPKDSSLNTKKANALLKNKPQKIELSLQDYCVKKNFF
jgi:dTDP-4-dehydrorhamnose reductase